MDKRDNKSDRKDEPRNIPFSTKIPSGTATTFDRPPLQKSSVSDSKHEATPPAQPVTKNGEISCSFEETNRIRAALGLRPLRKENPANNYQTDTTKTRPTHNGVALQRRLDKAKAGRAARNVIAPMSIAESVLVEQKPLNPALQKPFSKRKRAHIETPQISKRLKRDLAEGEQIILNLRDAPVLQDTKITDVLEPTTGTPRAHSHSSSTDEADQQINGMMYDGTDTVQFNNKTKPQGTGQKHSIERNNMQIEDDFHSTPNFSKRPRKRQKRRRRHQPNAQPVSKGHLQALRDKADKKVNNESESEDEYYIKMRAARRKEKVIAPEHTVDTILNAIASEDDVEDENASIVFNEMQQFLERVPLQSGSEKKEIPSSEIFSIRTNEQERVVDKSISTSPDKHPEAQKAAVVKQQPTLANGADVSAPTAQELKITSETNGMTGLAGTLARLRQMGALQNKPKQVGRARDEQYEDSDDDHTQNGQPSVKLSYVDEYGNKLTPKEAYRLLSRKFHGNAPKQNKREKRLRKMLESMKSGNS